MNTPATALMAEVEPLLAQALQNELHALWPAMRVLFGRSPPLWAIGVAHALKTIAHRVGSYKVKNSHMADKNMRYSNFIEPDQWVGGFSHDTTHPPTCRG